jgi:hypothetical protein
MVLGNSKNMFDLHLFLKGKKKKNLSNLGRSDWVFQRPAEGLRHPVMRVATGTPQDGHRSSSDY